MWPHLPSTASSSTAPIDTAPITGNNPHCKFGDAQLQPGEEVVVPADDLCLYHCICAASDVAHWKTLSPEMRVKRTKLLRDVLIQFIEDSGDTATAERLKLSGKDGHPGSSEFHHIAKYIGGPIKCLSLIHI